LKKDVNKMASHNRNRKSKTPRRRTTAPPEATPPKTPPVSSADPAGNHGGNGQAGSGPATTDNGQEQASAPGAAPNPFDAEALRLAAKYTPASPRQAQTTIPVTKRPDKEVFFRTHPGEEYTIPVVLIEYEDKLYLVRPDLTDALRDHEAAKVFLLRLCITRQGNLFFWALRVANKDGQLDNYGHSALEIADEATHTWLKVLTNRQAGHYYSFPATNQKGDPAWPEGTMNDYLAATFRNQLIDDPVNHLILQKWRGEGEA
jgi:hypothetical protein